MKNFFLLIKFCSLKDGTFIGNYSIETPIGLGIPFNYY